MTIRLRSFHPYLNTYHHQDGLLFQFILSDFLAIHLQATSLLNLKTPPLSAIECERYLVPVSTLAGASHDTMRLFAWSRDTSLLGKFKTYCALYAHKQKQLTPQQTKRVLLLLQNANQCWLYCMNCLDLLHTFNEEKEDPKLNESLAKSVSKLLQSVSRISKTFIPLFDSYKEDENVLFFIARHHQEFDQIYGLGFVNQSLANMHPEGISGIEKLLIERFSNRGFANLLPLIKAKMASIKQ